MEGQGRGTDPCYRGKKLPGGCHPGCAVCGVAPAARRPPHPPHPTHPPAAGVLSSATACRPSEVQRCVHSGGPSGCEGSPAVTCLAPCRELLPALLPRLRPTGPGRCQAAAPPLTAAADDLAPYLSLPTGLDALFTTIERLFGARFVAADGTQPVRATCAWWRRRLGDRASGQDLNAVCAHMPTPEAAQLPFRLRGRALFGSPAGVAPGRALVQGGHAWQAPWLPVPRPLCPAGPEAGGCVDGTTGSAVPAVRKPWPGCGPARRGCRVQLPAASGGQALPAVLEVGCSATPTGVHLLPYLSFLLACSQHPCWGACTSDALVHALAACTWAWGLPHVNLHVFPPARCLQRPAGRTLP